MKCTVTYTVNNVTTALLLEKTKRAIGNRVQINEMVVTGDVNWCINDSYRLERTYLSFFPATMYQVQVTITSNSIDICALETRKELGRRMVSEHILRLSGDNIEIDDYAAGFGREKSLLSLNDLINILDSLPVIREGEKS